MSDTQEPQAPEPAPKKLLLVAACALVDPDGRVLIAQRPEGKQLAGLWEFPGGKVEPGETPEETVVRELAEELGVRLRRVGEHRAAFRDPGSVFEIHFWEVEVAGVPVALEHTELRWVTGAEALLLPLAPTDLRFTREVLGSD